VKSINWKLIAGIAIAVGLAVVIVVPLMTWGRTKVASATGVKVPGT
jgi:hypothetical protein